MTSLACSALRPASRSCIIKFQIQRTYFNVPIIEEHWQTWRRMLLREAPPHIRTWQAAGYDVRLVSDIPPATETKICPVDDKPCYTLLHCVKVCERQDIAAYRKRMGYTK